MKTLRVFIPDKKLAAALVEWGYNIISDEVEVLRYIKDIRKSSNRHGALMGIYASTHLFCINGAQWAFTGHPQDIDNLEKILCRS